MKTELLLCILRISNPSTALLLSEDLFTGKITEGIMRGEEQEREEKVRRKEKEGKREQKGKGDLLLMSQFYQLMHFSWIPTNSEIMLC